MLYVLTYMVHIQNKHKMYDFELLYEIYFVAIF